MLVAVRVFSDYAPCQSGKSRVSVINESEFRIENPAPDQHGTGPRDDRWNDKRGAIGTAKSNRIMQKECHEQGKNARHRAATNSVRQAVGKRPPRANRVVGRPLNRSLAIGRGKENVSESLIVFGACPSIRRGF